MATVKRRLEGKWIKNCNCAPGCPGLDLTKAGRAENLETPPVHRLRRAGSDGYSPIGNRPW